MNRRIRANGRPIVDQCRFEVTDATLDPQQVELELEMRDRIAAGFPDQIDDRVLPREGETAQVQIAQMRRRCH
jgi:hypothetical protein